MIDGPGLYQWANKDPSVPRDVWNARNPGLLLIISIDGDQSHNRSGTYTGVVAMWCGPVLNDPLRQLFDRDVVVSRQRNRAGHHMLTTDNWTRVV